MCWVTPATNHKGFRGLHLVSLSYLGRRRHFKARRSSRSGLFLSTIHTVIIRMLSPTAIVLMLHNFFGVNAGEGGGGDIKLLDELLVVDFLSTIHTVIIRILSPLAIMLRAHKF